MADTTISGLTRALSTDTSAIIPITIAGVTYGIPVSAIITSSGSMGTGSIQLPVGNNNNRPNSPQIGSMRWNTTLNNVEYYNGTSWTGDVVSNAEILLLGGGGAGGRGTSWAGAGGGGGGFIQSTISITPGISYPIVVGAGGAAPTSTGNRGNNGQDSSGFSFTAVGGGGGGGNIQGNGSSGGSGGGGAYVGQAGFNSYGGTATQNQGFNGGDHTYGWGDGAGGGGAGGAGVTINPASGGYPGSGGAGKISSITGSATYFGGGGGGGAHNYNPSSSNGGIGGGGGGGSVGGGAGTAGTDGFGGGGGGGGNSGAAAGRGGNGTVIIAYPGTQSKATITGAGATTNINSRSGYVVHTFNVGNSTFTYTG